MKGLLNMKLTKGMRDPLRIKSSPFISDQEQKFKKFCRYNGITISPGTASEENPSINKRFRSYIVVFEPNFIDSLERKVIDYCNEHHIAYTFVRDADGFHHYSFSGFIDLSGYENLERTYVNIDRLLWEKWSKGCKPQVRTPKVDDDDKKASVWSRLKSLWNKKLPRQEPSEMDLLYESLGMDRYTLLSLSLPFDTPEEFESFYKELLREEEKNEKEKKENELQVKRATKIIARHSRARHK